LVDFGDAVQSSGDSKLIAPGGNVTKWFSVKYFNPEPKWSCYMHAFKRLFLISIVLSSLAVFASTATAGLARQSWPMWNKSDESNLAIIDHSTFDRFLKNYVVTNHPSGINRFRYGDVSPRDSKRLDAYIVQMSSIDPRQYRKREQKAYWLNLYNALTIQSLLKKYPRKSLDTRKLNPRIRVAGVKLRRADIGDRILRPIWHDYKVIFGLSCASVGCPAIQANAYTAANINKLLKQSAREFINHPRGLVVSRHEMRVSKIFDWYREDFGDDKRLLKLFAHYADDKKALYILGFSGDMKFNYDARPNSPETVWPL